VVFTKFYLVYFQFDALNPLHYCKKIGIFVA
jgi:hypothetical protein